MIGFDSLSDDGLFRVLVKYDEGLASYERGEINYPCGSKAVTVRRWRKEICAEIVRRGLDPLGRPELVAALARLGELDEITAEQAMAAVRIAYAKGHEDGARA